MIRKAVAPSFSWRLSFPMLLQCGNSFLRDISRYMISLLPVSHCLPKFVRFFINHAFMSEKGEQTSQAGPSLAQLKEHFRNAANQSADFRSFLEPAIQMIVKSAGFTAVALAWRRDSGLETIVDFEPALERLQAGRVQKESLKRAREQSLEKSNPIYLDSGRLPPGKSADDMEGEPVDPGNVPVFNGLSEDYMALPIPYTGAPLGVIEAMGLPCSGKQRQERLDILEGFAAGIAQFIKNQNIEQISRQLAGGIAYSKLLEGLLVQDDVERQFIKIANHTREITGADRVCLFQASHPVEVTELEREMHYDLVAVSGIDSVNSKSSLSDVLSQTGRCLLAAVARQQTDADKKRSATSVLVVMAQREHPDPASRPEEVIAYFEQVPSNWVVALALYDSKHRVIGLLFCEGLKANPEQHAIVNALKPLARSLGSVMAREAQESNERVLRMARSWVRFKGEKSSRRKMKRLAWVGIALLVVMLFPMPFKLKGEALLKPRVYEALPAYSAERLVDLRVEEGAVVGEGDVLAVFDQENLSLATLEAEVAWRGLQLEAEIAMQEGNEREARLLQNQAEQSRIQYAVSKRMLEESEIRAPFDAWVIGPQRMEYREGTYFSRGETVIELANLSEWQVRAFIREADILLLEERFQDKGKIEGELILQAAPSEAWQVIIDRDTDFTFGSTMSPKGESAFAITIPVKRPEGLPLQLANEFSGKLEVPMGYRPVAYVLFRDFIHFMRYIF